MFEPMRMKPASSWRRRLSERASARLRLGAPQSRVLASFRRAVEVRGAPSRRLDRRRHDPVDRVSARTWRLPHRPGSGHRVGWPRGIGRDVHGEADRSDSHHCRGYELAHVEWAAPGSVFRGVRRGAEFVPMAPDPAAMLRRCDAALLIGDPALFFDHAAAGLTKVDLGEEWTRLTGLPFVWAFWAGRPGALGRRRSRPEQASDRGVAAADDIAAAYCGPERAARGRAYLRENIVLQARRAASRRDCGSSTSWLSSRASSTRPARSPGTEVVETNDDVNLQLPTLNTRRASCRLSQSMILDRLVERIRAAAPGSIARRRSRSTRGPTALLGRLADDMRARKHPDGLVTYIIDRNVNYTNVCVARCNFCAFYRPVGSSEGYVLGFEDIFRKIDETIELGGGQLLLQGGHNPDLPIEWYEDLFRAVKQRYPTFRLHALSPPEVIHLSRMSRLTGPASRRPADCRGARQHTGRRRRDPRRPRPQAAQLLLRRPRRTSGWA